VVSFSCVIFSIRCITLKRFVIPCKMKRCLENYTQCGYNSLFKLCISQAVQGISI
jgi:hypothetical protein